MNSICKHVIIPPVVLYGCKTWTLTECDKNWLQAWERKVLCKTLGTVCEQGEWRMRTNDEVYKLYGELELVVKVRKRRLQYLSHVARVEEDRVPKKILDQHPGGRRISGRLRKRSVLHFLHVRFSSVSSLLTQRKGKLSLCLTN